MVIHLTIDAAEIVLLVSFRLCRLKGLAAACHSRLCQGIIGPKHQ
jgi:hypothetical protein